MPLSREASSPGRAVGDVLIAIVVGLAVGLSVPFAPAVSIAVIVATLVLGIRSLVEGDARRARLASGALVGSGAVYLYGAIVTVTACLDDRCGGADPVPLVPFAVVVLAGGLVTGVRSLPLQR